MSDRYESFVSDLMEHVVTTTPELPEWPGEPDSQPATVRRRARLAVAAAAFAGVLAVGALSMFFLRGSGPDVVAEPDLTEIVASDGVVLRGELWEGSDVALLVVGAYGAADGELLPIIEPLAARGFTVLTHDLRGDGVSGGSVQPGLLDEDLAAAVEYLRERADRVYVVAYRHAGAAALAAAGAGELAVDGLAGVFALERYLEQDALSALPDIDVPLFLIGATMAMSQAAPDGTVFGTTRPGREIFTESGSRIADQVAQFVTDTGG